MAQIKNINTAPIVDPAGTYLIATKDGHPVRVNGNCISQNITSEIVDAKISEVSVSNNENIKKLESEIKELKNIIEQLKVEIKSSQKELVIEPSTEIVEEATTEEAAKAKTKKSKK
jgi:hypothetical protein